MQAGSRNSPLSGGGGCQVYLLVKLDLIVGYDLLLFEHLSW